MVFLIKLIAWLEYHVTKLTNVRHVRVSKSLYHTIYLDMVDFEVHINVLRTENITN